MIKGGYKIVNFKGAALSGTAVSLSGIYDQIVDDYDKPVMVSGVSLNGDIMDDAYAGVQEKVAGDLSKSVELTVYGGIITVTEDDEVSFTVAKTPAELAAEIGNLEDLETTDKDSLVDAVNEVKRKSNIQNIQLSDLIIPEGWTLNENNSTVKYTDTNYDITIGLYSRTGLAESTRLTLTNILPASLSFNSTKFFSTPAATVIESYLDVTVCGFVTGRTIAVDNYSGSAIKSIFINISGLR